MPVNSDDEDSESDQKYRIEWPQPELWLEDPKHLLTDICTLRNMFVDLITVDIECGPMFPSEHDYVKSQMTVFLAIQIEDFVARLRAANAIKNLPISESRLRRVAWILTSYRKTNKWYDKITDEAGKEWYSSRSQPQFTFHEQVELCEEARDILLEEVNAVREFVRLHKILLQNSGKKTRRTAKPPDTEAITTYRKVIHELLDELSRNKLTPAPTRQIIRVNMKSRGIKLQNDVLSILVKEWQARRNGPHGPQRTD